MNEFEEKYKKDFLSNKDKIKRELIIEFQTLTNKLIEELEENKKILLNQQNKEKIRIKQLDKIKINYKEKEDYEKQRNEQINTMINNYKQFKMDNRRIDVYPTPKNKTRKIKKKEEEKYLKNENNINKMKNREKKVDNNLQRKKLTN